MCPLTDCVLELRDMTSQNHTAEHREAHKFKKESIVAVAAGALASISAAVLASFLGVAGTLIGAALVSVVSSLAGALYSGLLTSTQDVVRRSARRLSGTTGARGWRWPFRRPATRWLAVGLAALAMFALAVGSVTGLEAVIHKPLAAAIGGRDEGNATTSVGAAFGGSNQQRPAGRQGQPSTTQGGGSTSSSPSPTSGPGETGPPPSTTSPAPSTTGVPPSTR
jgi:hypothetical protein